MVCVSELEVSIIMIITICYQRHIYTIKMLDFKVAGYIIKQMTNDLCNCFPKENYFLS